MNASASQRSWAERVAIGGYRAATWLLPTATRTRFGDEMIGVFRAGLRRAGSGHPLLVRAVIETADLIRTAIRERLGRDPVSQGPRPPRLPLRGVRDDVSAAWRGLRARPGMAIVAVFTLALGIGSSTAVFSIVDSLLLRPLPYRDPGTLNGLMRLRPGGGMTNRWPVAELLTLRDVGVFEELHGYDLDEVDVGGTDRPEQIQIGNLTPGLFSMLGVAPRLGRLLRADEGLPGTDAIVLLSHALARRQFGDADAALDRSVPINGVAHRVIGVMPEDFRYPYQAAQAWRPRALHHPDVSDTTLQVVVRRVAGSSETATQQRLDALASSAEGAPAGRLWRAGILNTSLAGRVRVAAGAVLVLLLIACANAANLLLARQIERRGELALRAALGASRARILRLAALENVLLAVAAGVGGAGLAHLFVRGLVSIAPSSMIRFTANRIDVDGTALAFALAATAATALLFGVLPTVHAAVVDFACLASGRRASASAPVSRTRTALVIVQVALTLVLLSSSVTLLASFSRLTGVDMGFDPADALVATISPSAYRYGPEAGYEFVRAIHASVAALPDVHTAAIASGLPPSGGGLAFGLQLAIEGAPPLEPEPDLILSSLSVSPEFFETAGIEILAGRAFHPGDDTESAIILSDSMAKTYWNDGKAVGSFLRMHDGGPWRQVVGIAADVHLNGPEEPLGPMEYYLPLAPTSDTVEYTVLARTRPRATGVAAQIRDVVTALDPAQPLTAIDTWAATTRRAYTSPRFYLILVGSLAAAAVVLATVGVYAVVAADVGRRRHEFGVRVALGARPHSLRWLALGATLRTVALGGVLGAFGVWATSAGLEALLFGVDPLDPRYVGIALLGIATVALAASWVPTRSALRADPVAALRHS